MVRRQILDTNCRRLSLFDLVAGLALRTSIDLLMVECQSFRMDAHRQVTGPCQLPNHRWPLGNTCKSCMAVVVRLSLSLVVVVEDMVLLPSCIHQVGY